MNFLVFSSVLKCIFTLAFPSIQKRFLPCHFSASRGCNFLAFLYHFPTSENAFYVSICKSMYSIFSSMAAAYLVALFALFCVRLCVQRCISLLQRCTPERSFFSFGVLRIFFGVLRTAPNTRITSLGIA